MNIIDTLTNLGLSEQESLVYIGALKLGSSPASKIATVAGLKRTTVYPILRSLSKQGLVIVHFVKSERRYLAQKPEKLARQYQRRLDGLFSVIPSLNHLAATSGQIMGLRYLESIDEVRNYYLESTSEYAGQYSYAIVSATSWSTLGYEFMEEYRAKRAEAKIVTKVLLNQDTRDNNPTPSNSLREIKYLPSDYSFKSTMDIYPNSVLIIGPELTSLAVVIEIPAMIDIFQSVFKLIWNLLPEEL